MAKFLNPWIDPRVQLIRPIQAEKYLRSHGWQPYPSRNPRFPGFQPPHRANYTPLVGIPQIDDGTEGSDYIQRMIELVSDIAKFEERYAVDVLNEILAQPIDESLNGVHTHAETTTSAT